ncbi:hypothetical protein K491DRAFT_694637 [Lophiostoma macrostomum CBS 122681]|uniref:SWI-SNF chromatin-remodeling complex protein n=1 Tax=Lophiostoma macrostomum CBS 122681 TaxID=1314788 RepID=A0A6A6T0T6_9PLEO|nr:hypothetical protein K491DRAFT_694637 [Lophiostoma macrostomum CBS 122681]
MSGPYRFQQDSTRSPLDRQPPSFPAGQPPSFKTNVNRMKTKKWVEAKKNAYDGDDWGEYDEYDEYGVDTPPAQPEPSYFAQPEQRAEGARNFTDPQQRPGYGNLGRKNSFERGDEHRAFSAAHTPIQSDPYTDAQRGFGPPPPQAAPRQHAANRQTSGANSDISDTPQHRRDFDSSALPPPLHTRISPAPGNPTSSPSSYFPPRKSSIGQAESPSTMSPRDRATSNPQKGLPFIRPADIYKRHAEERERASLDSSRPSLDSLSGRPRDDVSSPDNLTRAAADASRALQPLQTVPERRSEYIPEVSKEQQLPEPPTLPTTTAKPSLPPIAHASSFGNEFLFQGTESETPTTQAQDPGFRSVVDQAFTRSDEQRSVPPTPVSKDSDSSVSRSNTNSTSGISPIMSRVPSSAASALKIRNQSGAQGSTPVIAEEGSEGNTPVSRPPSTAGLGGQYQVARKPSPSQSRNLSTPSPGESPARSPAIAPHTAVPEPEIAQLSTLSPTSPQTTNDGLSSGYSLREADLASAVRMSPEKAAPSLGAAEKESQAAFLETHQGAQLPPLEETPRSRSQSPSKGRVQELAGKFGDVSHSRRGSTQSNTSRNSIQSWERSHENSRPSSPTKHTPASERPAAEREFSFRPKLPGQWESYATTVPTPFERDDQTLQLAKEQEAHPEGYDTSSKLGDIDLSPTTTRHAVSGKAPSETSPDPLTDPLAALKAAGAAMGEAIQASVGLGSPSSDKTERDETQVSKDRTHGNVYLSRPVQFERTASSVASSVPPTPPAKDSPESEELPPPPPLKERTPDFSAPSSQQQTPVRPTIVPQLSMDPSETDQESDRLRKEIVASLSPLRTSETADSQPEQASLQPNLPGGANRESSILPSEYDSYWADGDHGSPRPSHDTSRNVQDHFPTSVEHSPIAARSTAPQLGDPIPPSLTTRFSWEDNKTPLPSDIHNQAEAGAGTEPVQHVQEPSQTATPMNSYFGAAEASRPSFGGFPEPYFGPSHSVAADVSEPAASSHVQVRSPTPPPESAKPVSSPTRTEISRAASPGLHVVNTELDPEAVDIPPRLSAEVSPPVEEKLQARDGLPAPPQEQELQSSPNIVAPSAPAAASEPTPKSPTTDKILGYRDIVNMKSTSERIATFNKTRDYWANTDHGLGDWMSSALSANPDLASQTPPEHRPQLSHSATSRHKAAASLSLFGKHPPFQSTPPKSSADQTPTTPTSSGVGAQGRPHASSSGGPGGRSASLQMGSKGKDLLHSAELLGGKGMKGAKGLFAKGKSRFGKSGSGDKDTNPNPTPQPVSASCEAFQEPELVIPPPRRIATMPVNLGSTQDLQDVKKRRRFSNPFNRSGRSQSRPQSMVLPRSETALTSRISVANDTAQDTRAPREGKERRRFSSPFHRSSRSQSRPQSMVLPRNEVAMVSRMSIDHNAPDTSQDVRERRRFSSPFHRTGRSRSRPTSVVLPQSELALASRTSIDPTPQHASNDVKERRRFSSPFHRTSRSRSRPSSIVLPKSMTWGSNRDEKESGEIPPVEAEQPYSHQAPGYWNFALDAQGEGDHATPPREAPHAYQAPDSWNTGPGAQREINPFDQSTPPSGGLTPPDRLGVLPSPAKSQFSFPTDRDEDVPPVPPIPRGMEEEWARGHNARSDVGNRARMLQSIIRYATPPTDTPPIPPPAIEAAGRTEAGESEQPRRLEGAPQDRDDASQQRMESVITNPPDQPRVSRGEQVHVGNDMPPAVPSGLQEAPMLRNEPGLRASLQKALPPLPHEYAEGPSGQDLDDDDLPPQLNHDPIPPTVVDPGLDVSPITAPSTGVDVSPLLSSARLDADIAGGAEQSEPAPQSDLKLTVPQTQEGGQGVVGPMVEPALPSVAEDNKFEGTRTTGIFSSPHEASCGEARREMHPAAAVGASGLDGPSNMHHHVAAPMLKTTPRTRAADEPITDLTMNEDSSLITPTIVRHRDDFALEVEKAFQAASLAAATSEIAPIQSQTPQADAGRPYPPAGPAPPVETLSASPYQVLHAVQYNNPSHSSFESWEQDSVAAPSQSEGSQLGDKAENREVPPVPQIPSSVQHQQQNLGHRQEPGPAQYASNMAAPNGHPGVYHQQPMLPNQQYQQYQQAPLIQTPAPPVGTKRSQSLLSAISSAVSDDRAPVSPASSHAGFSRPSSRGYAPQRTSARDSPVPAQIEEEPMSQRQKHLSNESYSSYDLYADHNGVVRGMQDKQGQPLRVKTGQVPDVSPTTSPLSGSTITPKAAQNQEEEDTTRYSDERPMSFVSGPRDSSGRPQDEINMPTPSTEKGIPPVPQVPPQHQGHVAQHRPMSSMHSVSPQGSMDARTIRENPRQSQSQQPQGVPTGGQTESPTRNHHPRQHARTVSRSTVSPPPPSQASPPPQPSPPQSLTQRLPLQNGTGPAGPSQDPRISQDPRMQGVTPQDPRMSQDPGTQGVSPQDPRMQQLRTQDLRAQGIPSRQESIEQENRLRANPEMSGALGHPPTEDPRLQMQIPPGQVYAQDPRLQTQTGTPTSPRNMYELQQQVMQQRTNSDPRMQGAGFQHQPGVSPPPAAALQAKPEEKSRKISSMFKGFGLKSHDKADKAAKAQQPTPPALSTPPPQSQGQPQFQHQRHPQFLQQPGPQQQYNQQQQQQPQVNGQVRSQQPAEQLQQQQQYRQQPQPQANGQMRTQQLAEQPQQQQQQYRQQPHPGANGQMNTQQSIGQPQQQQQYRQQPQHGANGQMSTQQLAVDPSRVGDPIRTATIQPQRQFDEQIRTQQLAADVGRLGEPTRTASIQPQQQPQSQLQPQQQPDGQVRTQQLSADTSRLGEPIRSASVQSGISGVSALPSEQAPARRPEGRPGTTASVAQSHRQSIAESHFSHVSQDSTQVQAAESRLDLRNPASPPPGRGIPPRQPSTGAPAAPRQPQVQQGPPQAQQVSPQLPQGPSQVQQVSPQVQQLPPQSQVPALAQPPRQAQQQPQPFRMHSAGVPDSGKKKRSSLFGTLFGRNSTAHNAPPRMSKEEKKAQKAQKQHGTPPPALQRPPTQQWPPPQQQQQQQPMRPVQAGMQYGPPPMGRPFPGMGRPVQGMSPQGLSPQGMSPQGLSPQGSSPQGQAPQSHPLYQQHQALLQQQMAGQRPIANGMSQQYQQPQGVPQQMVQPQSQIPNGVPLQFTHPQLQQQQMLRQMQQQQMVAQQGLPQGNPQQYAPVTNIQKPQIQTQQPVPAGSAYNDTRRIATQAGSPQDQQPRPATNGTIPPPALPRQSVEQRPEASSPAPPAPPLDGYYKPDDKKGLLGQPESDQAMDQQLPSSQRPSQRRVQQQQQQPQETLVTSPTSPDSAVTVIPDQQQQLSTPIEEPQYDTPQIPAAYTPVHGPYVSPSTHSATSNPQFPSLSHHGSTSGRQNSEPQMQTISPQVSNISQTAAQPRTLSDASIVSALSPISDPSPGPTSGQSQPALYQRAQKSRMSSITEQTQHERPWNLDLPPGATEQEIIQARHQQYIRQQFAAQQQMHAERTAQSPSPHLSRHTQSPSPHGTQQQSQQAQQPAYQGHTHASSPPQQVRQSPDRVASPQQQLQGQEQAQPYPQEVFHKQQQFYTQQQVPQTPPAGSQNEQRMQHQPEPGYSNQESALQPRYNSPPKASTTPQPQSGFREVLPRSSPQPYAVSEQSGQATLDTVQEHTPTSHHTPSPQLPLQPAPIHPNQTIQPAQYPLPTSPPAGDIKSPINPQINSMPPPPLPHSPPAPIGAGIPTNNPSPLISQQQHGVDVKEYGPPPPPEQPDYEDQAPDEPPPSYDGPGIQNEGMDKLQPHRPPNILTDAEVRGRERDPRSRQPSIGILQHPQPASMAASPQRSQADMGADVLRRQLLQQEERERMERIQRAEQQRVESERERQEREIARARARELERSVSGGGRVGSLRSVAGSRAGARSGWERRGENSAMPVFELPAEDDEPVMRATSFPGQEWVPSFTDD